jgi:hypothetical protein
MNDDSDDSDEWATEELTFATSNETAARKEEDHRPGAWQPKDEVDETDWQAPIPVSPQVQIDSDPNNQSNPGESMILVDMTALTELDTRFGTSIHCRFDAHSVNDPGPFGRCAQKSNAISKRLQKTRILLPQGSSSLAVLPYGDQP